MDLYQKLIRDGETGIDQLVSIRQHENVQLDFKCKTDAANGSFSPEDMKVFAKALSAFSNSAGGLIVWGVEAKPGADGIDCAQRTVPISAIDQFSSEANTLVGQLLQPKHDGIDLTVVASKASAQAGYLLVRVERSERRPHRSEAKNQKQYFKRAGDSSFPMEHYDIEDAFKRISTPDLAITWKVVSSWTDGAGNKPSRFLFRLKNASNLTAKFPYLYVLDPANTLNFREISTYGRRSDGAWSCFYAGADQVINPGTASDVCDALLGDTRTGLIENREGVFLLGGVPLAGEVVRLSFKVGCENTAMKEFEIAITACALQDHRL